MIPVVPVISIAAMAVSAVVTVLLPSAAFIYLNQRAKADSKCMIVGAGTFVVFALVLESILNYTVSRIWGETLGSNVWLYALYGGLAAGLFEETGRFITMKLFMKKDLTKQNALMFGVGHGGAEALIVGAMTYISNIAMSVMINMNMTDKLLATAQGEVREQAIEQLSALGTTPSYEFLFAGLERASAFALQICLSYVVYRAVRYKKPVFYVLAVFIHFAVDAGIVLLAKKAMLPTAAVEFVLLAAVVVISLMVSRAYKAEKEEIQAVE